MSGSRPLLTGNLDPLLTLGKSAQVAGSDPLGGGMKRRAKIDGSGKRTGTLGRDVPTWLALVGDNCA